MVGSARGGVDPRRGGRQGTGGGVEGVGVEEAGTEPLVVRVDAHRDGEGVVVAEEDGVLEVAEVAADRPGRGRRLLARQQAEEAREVDDAAVDLFFARRRRAERGSQPASPDRRPDGVDHHVGGVLDVADADAGHQRGNAAAADEPAHDGAVH